MSLEILKGEIKTLNILLRASYEVKQATFQKNVFIVEKNGKTLFSGIFKEVSNFIYNTGTKEIDSMGGE